MNEPVRIIAGPWPGRIAGSVKMHCTDCGAEVSIAPSTIKSVMKDRDGVEILCHGCVDWCNVIQNGVYEPTPDQKAEIGDDFNQAPITAMLKALGVKFYKPPKDL